MRYGRLRRRRFEQAGGDATAAALLGVLSCEDLLNEIGLVCNPLRLDAARALTACSHGLHAVIQMPLDRLRSRHKKAKQLATELGFGSCAELADATVLRMPCTCHRLNTAYMHTLGSLLGSGALPLVKELYLGGIFMCDTDLRVLCKGLGAGAAAGLVNFNLSSNNLGPRGAAALAAALGRGALPNLEVLGICNNRVGNQGLTALAAPLRKLSALKWLYLTSSSIGDEGVQALVGGLGEKELKALEGLHLASQAHRINPISDVGCAALSAALNRGALPSLARFCIDFIPASHHADLSPASGPARQAVLDAVKANQARQAP